MVHAGARLIGRTRRQQHLHACRGQLEADRSRASRFETAFAVDLFRPDFAALAGAFEIPVRETDVEGLAGALGWAAAVDGPALVLLPTVLHMYRPVRGRAERA